MKKILLILFIFLFVVLSGLAIYFSLTTEVTKNLDTYTYDLPFKAGTRHKVVQGYGGMFSHKYKAALDFSMSEGTPVCAARDGVIYSLKDDSDEGGPFPSYQNKANYIIIRHDDGSFGCYWHLQKDGVMVKKGRVAKGQLIGYSGSTGFVLRPHLHFAVKQKLTYDKDSFVKTKFRTTEGIQLLIKGGIYERPKE